MSNFLRLLIAFLLSTQLYAEPIDIYEYRSLVTTQERKERNQVTSDGLAEVIVRASGQQSVLQDPGVLRALSNSSRYLVEYRYEASSKTVTLNKREVPASQLVLKYSSAAIEKLLKDLQLPVWPVNRPNVLVWMVADRGTGKELVSVSAAPDALKAVSGAALRRGLPVLSPLLDLEDQVALSANSLWKLDEQEIRAASARYQPDSILVGRLSKTSQGEWRSAWLLLSKKQSEVFDGSAADIDNVAAQGIDFVADYFFKLYGYQPLGGDSHNLALQVAGIDEFSDYVQIAKYLEGLAIVRGVDISVVLGRYLLLNVATEVDARALQEALALDNKLVPETAAPTYTAALPGSAENPLKYIWQ